LQPKSARLPAGRRGGPKFPSSLDGRGAGSRVTGFQVTSMIQPVS